MCASIAHMAIKRSVFLMTSHIAEIPTMQADQMAALMQRAFAHDEALRRILSFNQNEMTVFWQNTARLYASLEDQVRLGAYEGDRLIGLAVGWEGQFHPGLARYWLFAWRMFRRLGWRGLKGIGRWFELTYKQGFTLQPCLHLITIAVDNGYRNRGWGKKLLSAFAEQARVRGLPLVQLECESDTPARRKYEQTGFVQERTFTAGGAKWSVMTKPIIQAEET